MSTLLGLDKTADYETLKEWCLTVFDYLLEQEPEFKLVADDSKALIASYDRYHNIKKMRALYKEHHLILRDLPPNQIEELNQILTEKFGHNLADVAKMETKAIEKIIKRGRIRNDTEYRLVWQREDEIYTDDSQFEYAETLRKLLSDYENQKEVK